MVEGLKTQKQEKFMTELFLEHKITVKFFNKSYLIWDYLKTSKECGLFIENFLKVLKNQKTIESFDKYLLSLMIKKQAKESELETQKYLAQRITV